MPGKGDQLATVLLIVENLRAEHGSYESVARHLGINSSFISHARNGRLYPGLINALVRLNLLQRPRPRKRIRWNPKVTPQNKQFLRDEEKRLGIDAGAMLEILIAVYRAYLDDN